jgi:hypothetical protein
MLFKDCFRTGSGSNLFAPPVLLNEGAIPLNCEGIALGLEGVSLTVKETSTVLEK